MAIDPLALCFANEVDAYELGRPGYPAGALDAALEQLGLGADGIVVELGAGTGKLTRDLVRRVRCVIPIEPLSEMRAALERATGIEARDGTAESIPVVTASANAVFAAEAFHWFHGPAARDEIVRVLRPTGGLAVMWNRLRKEREREPWRDGVKEVLERRRPVGIRPENRYTSMLWRASLEDDARFGPLEASVWPNERELTPDEYVAMIASWSVVAALPPSEREATISELQETFDAHGVEHIHEPLETRLFVTRLRTEAE